MCRHLAGLINIDITYEDDGDNNDGDDDDGDTNYKQDLPGHCFVRQLL